MEFQYVLSSRNITAHIFKSKYFQLNCKSIELQNWKIAIVFQNCAALFVNLVWHYHHSKSMGFPLARFLLQLWFIYFFPYVFNTTSSLVCAFERWVKLRPHCICTPSSRVLAEARLGSLLLDFDPIFYEGF